MELYIVGILESLGIFLTLAILVALVVGKEAASESTVGKGEIHRPFSTKFLMRVSAAPAFPGCGLGPSPFSFWPGRRHSLAIMMGPGPETGNPASRRRVGAAALRRSGQL